MAHYTQILACTRRPAQAFGALKGLTVYVFPQTPVGMIICEKTSEAIDVRIVIQVTRLISRALGHGCAVLAFAGDQQGGFWCGLFDGGVLCFEHNRLIGPRSFADGPATLVEVERLCNHLGGAVDPRAVHEILNIGSYASAMARHAALAAALGLPSWSPGVGYSQIVEGNAPPEAGTPRKPPGCVEEIRAVTAPYEDLRSLPPLVRFQETCGRAFKFLEEELGFCRESRQDSEGRFPRMIGKVLAVGTGNLRPGYRNAYIVCYRGRHLIVVIEGLSFGERTRMCLVDRSARHLDLTALVERRDPELLDLCRLAEKQDEQIPLFAEALRNCAPDVLTGNLRSIAAIEKNDSGFSFSAFSSGDDADYILALYGPLGKPGTIRAKIRHAAVLRRTKGHSHLDRIF
jgi:hypothetical protein